MTIEKALVDAKMGNTKAQQYLYEQYKVSLFTICLHYSRDRSEAEESPPIKMY